MADVVQVRGNIGVTALLSGDAHAVNNVGTVIRAMDLAASLSIDLGWEIVEKARKNDGRPYKHGNKRY